jgi:intron-binding protein aquarius
LTTYNGQKALIDDVLERRCRWNPLFGLPKHVSTVDKFQGQQNDYVLLSLVRTKSVGHLRDVRRLIVALSRARLGLYIFGRFKLFDNCYDLKVVFDILKERPTNTLWLHGQEVWGPTHGRELKKTGLERQGGSNWKPDKAAGGDAVFQIDDVAHMGQYVHQMIQEQVSWMKEQKIQAQKEELEAQSLIAGQGDGVMGMDEDA